MADDANNEDNSQEDNILNMSDAEALEMDFPEQDSSGFDQDEEQESSNEEEEQSEENDDNQEEEEEEENNSSENEDNSDEEEQEESEENDDNNEEESDEENDDSENQENDLDKKKKKGKQAENADDNNKEEEEEKQVNHKEQLAELLAPFKANGVMQEVGTVEDARTLMSMGANYHKKMVGLKPHLRIVKMLENNDLLDVDKLTFFIDLDKKDPEAIQKFIKDSGIDPLDVNVDEDSDYKPKNTYKVSDEEVAVDSVLDEIQHTESYGTTIDIIGNKWDTQSRTILGQNPETIRILNDQVASGVYAQIDGIIQSERTLGRLRGLSDIEAYKQVGELLEKNGTLIGMTKTDNTDDSENKSNKSNSSNKSSQQDNADLNKRRKAAAPTKGKRSAKKSGKDDYNPLNMSDEEFEKLEASRRG